MRLFFFETKITCFSFEIKRRQSTSKRKQSSCKIETHRLNIQTSAGNRFHRNDNFICPAKKTYTESPRNQSQPICCLAFNFDVNRRLNIFAFLPHRLFFHSSNVGICNLVSQIKSFAIGAGECEPNENIKRKMMMKKKDQLRVKKRKNKKQNIHRLSFCINQ